MKLAGKTSATFVIIYGTRQGSVLSPVMFSVYLDDLLKELRALQLGYHIGRYRLGTCGFVYDLFLMAPCRDVFQRMRNVCEQYAVEHHLVFSTYPVAS